MLIMATRFGMICSVKEPGKYQTISLVFYFYTECHFVMSFRRSTLILQDKQFISDVGNNPHLGATLGHTESLYLEMAEA